MTPFYYKSFQKVIAQSGGQKVTGNPINHLRAEAKIVYIVQSKFLGKRKILPMSRWLLIDWSGGDRNALEQLMPLVYRKLQLIAHRVNPRRESQNHTLQTTAPVHKQYLKLIDRTHADWQNRAQFFGVTAQAIRRILIDRERRSEKRISGATLCESRRHVTRFKV